MLSVYTCVGYLLQHVSGFPTTLCTMYIASEFRESCGENTLTVRYAAINHECPAQKRVATGSNYIIKSTVLHLIKATLIKRHPASTK